MSKSRIKATVMQFRNMAAIFCLLVSFTMRMKRNIPVRLRSLSIIAADGKNTFLPLMEKSVSGFLLKNPTGILLAGFF